MGLRASEHTGNLLALYFVTIIMRASFYISIAVIQSLNYMNGGLHEWEIAAVLVVYPLAELTSVSFFGSYSDKIGRRPILIVSLFITAASAYLFAIAPTAAILIVFSAVFGIGAASKVSTTLSMIADMSSEHDRASLMGYYDLSTLSGLAGGYGLGIILLEMTIAPSSILFMAGSACAVSGIVAFFAIRETRTHVHVEMSTLGLIKKVASDRKIQMLIPVYVPIIAMYGLLIGYAVTHSWNYYHGTSLRPLYEATAVYCGRPYWLRNPGIPDGCILRESTGTMGHLASVAFTWLLGGCIPTSGNGISHRCIRQGSKRSHDGCL
jgi:MFS family permease